ncbi:hypothetical protein ACHAXM_002978 [Skeletonema potamos]
MPPKFSHRFSGVSVWIEPDPDLSSQLISEMEYLRLKCGGSDAGQYAFVPHCTLLYNTSLHVDGGDGDQTDGSCDEQTKKQQGEYLLRQCLEEYRKQISDQQQTNDGNLQLIPTSQFYFHYPKTADNGKGFGCCISLLMLDTTHQLQLLHDIVRNRFPPDERHGSKNSNANNDESEEEGKETRFTPHMALVYAPEDHENVINGWLEKYTVQNEEKKQYAKWYETSTVGWNARYLSLWSTEGTLDEWYPIFKLDLAAT